MGHRALVAYRRPDRRYDLRYSHWGGDTVAFAERISAETPLADGAVDPALIATAVDRNRVLTAYLDPCRYEALYLVAPGENYYVSAYRVCWLEWIDTDDDCDDDTDGDRGAIVAVESETADHRIRTWFRAVKTTLADVVEMGALSPQAAQTYLEARVCEDEDGTLYTYGEPDSIDSEYVPETSRFGAERWHRSGEDERSDDASDGGGVS